MNETARRPLVLVYLAVFGGYFGQQMIMPILPPLARELGLSEVQLGLVMTVAAAIVVLASPFWGRRSEALGRKPVIVTGLVGAIAGLAGFAVVTQLGLDGRWSLPVLFGLILVSRSLLFGGFMAAIPVSAQTYVVDVTSDEKARVRGLSLIGAVTGLALVLGPAIGGLLGRFGLLVPLYVAPAALVPLAIVVAWRLPAEPRHRDKPEVPRLRPFDGRIWPFLLIGFGLFLSLALMQMTIGFLLQDRLELSAEQTARTTGFALLCAGLPMLVMQAAVVPKLGWRPARMLRVGIPIAMTGFLLAVPDLGQWPIFLGVALTGIGYGLAVPGYTSAPTLLVDRNEQAGLAGLLGATTALTFVFGPVLGTSLYQLAPALPYLLAAALLAALLVFVLTHRALRAVAAVPLATADSATGH
ncbi:MFS transporter [Kribbella deserti]|uniref:MFS transporter n=1 Tax=Kribbella deserti TaxID=1926257 RepID=A0ABV6QII9_9ACTN